MTSAPSHEKYLQKLKIYVIFPQNEELYVFSAVFSKSLQFDVFLKISKRFQLAKVQTESTFNLLIYT